MSLGQWTPRALVAEEIANQPNHIGFLWQIEGPCWIDAKYDPVLFQTKKIQGEPKGRRTSAQRAQVSDVPSRNV